MTAIDVQLLVTLKGVDLAERTAEIALVDKMGYSGRLLGLKRFDYFRFRIDTATDPGATLARLRRVLDGQSTFYNRNKHVYGLDARWDGASRHIGVEPADLKRKWVAEMRHFRQKRAGRDFDGKGSEGEAILTSYSLGGFLVETLVEDDDARARTSIAAKIVGGLSSDGETAAAEVTCLNRATVWWMAIHTPNAEAAKQTAQDIVVTTRREKGLLMNPNYQRAEVVSVAPLAAEQ